MRIKIEEQSRETLEDMGLDYPALRHHVEGEMQYIKWNHDLPVRSRWTGSQHRNRVLLTVEVEESGCTLIDVSGTDESIGYYSSSL